MNHDRSALGRSISMHCKLRILRLAVYAVCWCALAVPAVAIDRIKLTQGSQQNGEVTDSTSSEVTVTIGATKRQVPVNEIDTIQFEDEPKELTQARVAIRGGRYVEAASALGKIAPGDIKRPLIAQDVAFYEALATGRLALAGSAPIADAGKKMLAFEKAHPNSFHYFEACEVLGDLLVAMGNYTAADAYYAKLAAAPWPQYKQRATMLSGRVLVGQKKFPEAEAKFDEVLKVAKDDSLRLAASLGKAAALSGAGQHDAALKLADEVIAQAGPTDEATLARAYNIKGASLQAAGKVPSAIVAYLHVDLLYSRSPEQHAEALAHLAELFAADNLTQRAQQARSRLKDKYPQSVWNTKP